MINFDDIKASSEFDDLKNIPHEIIIVYENDNIDILRIHDNIRERFCYQFTNIKKYEAIRDNLKLKLDECMVDIDRKNLEFKISCRNEFIQGIKTHRSWNEYKSQSKKLLEDFLKNRGDRERIIEKYLLVASKYIKLNVKKITTNDACPECGNSDINEYEIKSNGFMECLKCSLNRRIITQNASLNEPVETKKKKDSYKDIDNFIRRMNTFEGKYNESLPEKLFTQLEEYFDKKLPITCEEIRKLPLEEKKKYTSTRLLEEGLKNTENSNYYKNSEILANRIWGWPFVVLTDEQKEKILSDYAATQKVFFEMNNNKKGSSLNVNLRLYWHLRMIDFPCSIEDFKVPTSNESSAKNTNKFKRMCEGAGLVFKD